MLAHRWDRCHWTEGAYDTSTRGTTQQRPILVKRLADLTWLKGSGPAHKKPVNDVFTYSPFTTREVTTGYGLPKFGPVASSRPFNMIPARCNFRPMYGP